MDCSPPGSWVHGIFLGMNTGIGCHFLCLITQSCPTLCNSMDCSPPGPSVHEDFPGKNTGMGCHALLQGILPTQESNLGFPHCRRILYPLSHQGSPAISSSRGSSQPRNQTQAPRIAGGLFIDWATREAQPFPPPGDLPNPGTEARSLHLLHWQVHSLPFAPWEAHMCIYLDVSLSIYLHDT